ncbi:MFS transporter [Pseudonocardia sp. TRM90224]|uniref:MFS transporter n=1 Tax=Pseudonocardia sp. TRM90224 TaxID=2812678 RepID=UPI001E51381D|nr:MFS transporter [Pseudonocardia sp. TRM90224]
MRKDHGRTLFLLAGIQFLLILDTAIINVAAPSIGRELGIAAAELSWVANAYLVAFGGLLLISGRAADLLPRRTLLVVGLGVLVVGSVAGALAADAWLLIAARATQGVGAAFAAAAAFAALLAHFPDGPERHRALGVFAAMAGAGGAAGTVLGGVLTDVLGWRSTFGLNVVAGAALALLALCVLGPQPRRPRPGTTLDVAGALTVTAGLGLLAYALVSAGIDGWTAPRTLLAAASAAGLLTVFVLVQRWAPEPIVPAAAVRQPAVRAANLLAALSQFVLFPMFFLVSLYMQDVLGFPPMAGGLGLLPLSITVVAVAANTGRMIARFGVRPVMVVGCVLLAGGLAGLVPLSAGSSFFPDVLCPTLVIGVGLPLVAVTTNVAATAHAGPDGLGVASGLVTTSQQFGAVLGLAVLGGVGHPAAFAVAAALAAASAAVAFFPHTGSVAGAR